MTRQNRTVFVSFNTGLSLSFVAHSALRSHVKILRWDFLRRFTTPYLKKPLDFLLFSSHRSASFSLVVLVKEHYSLLIPSSHHVYLKSPSIDIYDTGISNIKTVGTCTSLVIDKFNFQTKWIFSLLFPSLTCVRLRDNILLSILCWLGCVRLKSKIWQFLPLLAQYL